MWRPYSRRCRGESRCNRGDSVGAAATAPVAGDEEQSATAVAATPGGGLSVTTRRPCRSQVHEVPGRGVDTRFVLSGIVGALGEKTLEAIRAEYGRRGEKE